MGTAIQLHFLFIFVVHLRLFVNITFILFVLYNLCLSEGKNVKNCFAIINNNILYSFFSILTCVLVKEGT